MNVFVLTTQYITSNDALAKTTMEQFVFVKADQARQKLLEIFEKYLMKYSNISGALEKAVRHLINKNEFDLIEDLIKADFKTKFQFSIAELPIEGHVLG